MEDDGKKLEAKKALLGEWAKVFLVVAAAYFSYGYLQGAGWLGKIGEIGAPNRNLSLGVALLTGVAASFSSCLAVVGGMVIAFSEKYRSDPSKSFFGSAFLPNLKFHAGRTLTFFVLGGVLGFVGGGIDLSGKFISIYTIFIAVVMGWLGFSILGIVPSVSVLGLRPPKFVPKLWARLENSEHGVAPWLLGGITFFLPCGFTQSMQLLALASGSFLSGSLVMAAFALGTMPVLLAVGTAASWARFKKMTYVSKAAGVIVVLFAAYTLNSGLALQGASPNPSESVSESRPEKKSISANAPANPAVQKIGMKITGRGFEPSVLRVKRSIPVRFAINGDQASGCTNEIVIPDLGIEKEIKKGENIVEFTPEKPGPIAYSCWMGMVRGKIIVE